MPSTSVMIKQCSSRSSRVSLISTLVFLHWQGRGTYPEQVFGLSNASCDIPKDFNPDADLRIFFRPYMNRNVHSWVIYHDHLHSLRSQILPCLCIFALTLSTTLGTFLIESSSKTSRMSSESRRRRPQSSIFKRRHAVHALSKSSKSS